MKNLRRLRLILISIFVAILGLSLFLIILNESPVIFYIFVLVVVSALTIAVIWHSKVTAYKCPLCSKEFAISAFVDFFSPHLPYKKLLNCPCCNIVNWCEAHSSSAKPG